jgi:hypothetical protein
MVYKKYIRKNGKLYGPYIYQSRRVDGKVISEYIGMGNEKEKKIVPKKIITFIFLFALVAVSLFFLNLNLTGNVTFDLNSRINENLELSLFQGELIPSSSKIKIYSNEKDKEYFLKDLIQPENQSENFQGNYYFDGTDLKDSGEGIGIEGIREEYPTVYFKFKIVENEENNSEEKIVNQTQNKEENTPQENSSEGSSEETEIIIDEVIEENSPEENIKEEQETKTTEITISGNVISTEPIQADVSYNSEFNYNLKEGQKIEIVSGSVKTEENDLEESVLDIKIVENKAIIKTTYKKEIKGFGKDYLGSATKIPLDKTKINISKEKITRVELILDETQEESNKTPNEKENTSSENSSEESKKEKETIIVDENETKEFKENTTLENETALEEANESILNESLILVQYLGTSNISTIQSNYRDKTIIKMKISNYEREFSYSQKLNQEELEEKIEKDKQEFIKDLANKFTEEKFSEEFID